MPYCGRFLEGRGVGGAIKKNPITTGFLVSTHVSTSSSNDDALMMTSLEKRAAARIGYSLDPPPPLRSLDQPRFLAAKLPIHVLSSRPEKRSTLRVGGVYGLEPGNSICGLKL